MTDPVAYRASEFPVALHITGEPDQLPFSLACSTGSGPELDSSYEKATVAREKTISFVVFNMNNDNKSNSFA
nr:hypothetical protein A6C57_25220 [Fibrella sp. ES10-3-2-2]